MNIFFAKKFEIYQTLHDFDISQDRNMSLRQLLLKTLIYSYISNSTILFETDLKLHFFLYSCRVETHLMFQDKENQVDNVRRAKNAPDFSKLHKQWDSKLQKVQIICQQYRFLDLLQQWPNQVSEESLGVQGLFLVEHRWLWKLQYPILNLEKLCSLCGYLVDPAF